MTKTKLLSQIKVRDERAILLFSQKEKKILFGARRYISMLFDMLLHTFIYNLTKTNIIHLPSMSESSIRISFETIFLLFVIIFFSTTNATFM